MKPKIKVILAEKHMLIRRSIFSLLKRDGLLQVVAEVSDITELLIQLQKVETDVILLDLQMISETGHQKSVEALRTLSPKTKIIQWNMNPDVNAGNDAINNGTGIYLTSDCDESMLFDSIHSHHTRDFDFDDLIPNFEPKESSNGTKKNINETLSEISERQIQIIKQICLGKNNQQIAEALFLTASNVDSHKTKIYRKTNCNNAVHLFRFALKHGIIKV